MSTPRNPYFQAQFPATEFIARRNKLMDAMGRQGAALLAGAPEVPGFDPFRQTNDFFYLCGVEVPHAYLLIDAQQGVTTLYLPPRNEKHEKTDGPTLCSEDAPFCSEKAGIDQVKELSLLPADLARHTLLYMPHAEAEGMRMCQDTLRHRRRSIMADPMAGQPSPEIQLIARTLQFAPGATLHDLSPILRKMRLIKSPAEIQVMRRTGRLSALAAVEAMKATRPGLYEYQLGAICDFVYQFNGATGVGYRPIIAAGENIWMMHYWRNNSPLKDGELVLLDYAPDLFNYTNDIGRLWPVNGTFSPLQRELYGFVAQYHTLLLSLIKPGLTPEDILAQAAGQMRPLAEKWPFSKPIYRDGALKLLESKRPLSHGVGLAVHEVEGYFGRPLEVGLVFAVDPELFIPEEKLYIRCEDTVVVTESGCENLTADAPYDIDGIEELMKQPGMLTRIGL